MSNEKIEVLDIKAVRKSKSKQLLQHSVDDENTSKKRPKKLEKSNLVSARDSAKVVKITKVAYFSKI